MDVVLVFCITSTIYYSSSHPSLLLPSLLPLSAPPTNGTPIVATISLISRLGWKRAGTRFNTRGVDDDGNCANFVEVPTGPEYPPDNQPDPLQKVELKRKERRQWVKAGIINETSDEVWCHASFTRSTELAAKENLAKAKRSFEEMVPKHYQDFAKVFSDDSCQVRD